MTPLCVPVLQYSANAACLLPSLHVQNRVSEALVDGAGI